MKKYAFLPIVFALLGCGNHSLENLLDCSDIECLLDGGTEILSLTGYLASKENLSNIPQDISVSNISTSLPSSYSLENKFPPVGDQEQYGTCVAWAVGYGLKTALNGMEKGWSASDLSKSENQTSPKDLWFAINSTDKGPGCGGTSFEAALDALISKGAGSLSSVPYKDMGSCSGASTGYANNKLANYRKIGYNNTLDGGRGTDGMTADNFKSYLSQGRPIVFGAKLGDRFMRWNSSASISSDTYNNPGMQHAYHAMVLVGYDDSKNAFKVRNSWGTDWGDKGNIWVDYDFFLKNFAFAAFVAQNPPPPVDEEVKEDNLLEGYDLLAAFAMDELDTEKNPSGDPRKRGFSYDVYNNGKNPILASQKWTILYMYYDAFDANKYGIIYEDYYTNEYEELGSYGKYTETKALAGGIWNHVNVQPGKKVGEVEFGSQGFYIPYEMPRITGKYYLVVYADAYEKIRETNEDNNFYFIGAEGGKPLEFVNGVMQNKPANAAAKVLAKEGGKIPRALAKSVQEIGGSANAYTPAEIKILISQSKKNGTLAKKIVQYRESEKKPVKKRRAVND